MRKTRGRVKDTILNKYEISWGIHISHVRNFKYALKLMWSAFMNIFNNNSLYNKHMYL